MYVSSNIRTLLVGKFENYMEFYSSESHLYMGYVPCLMPPEGKQWNIRQPRSFGFKEEMLSQKTTFMYRRLPIETLHLLRSFLPWKNLFVDDLSVKSSMFKNWLVVWTPLKNISQLGWLFPIYGKIKNVPNHQSDDVFSHHSHVFFPLKPPFWDDFPSSSSEMTSGRKSENPMPSKAWPTPGSTFTADVDVVYHYYMGVSMAMVWFTMKYGDYMGLYW